MTSTPSNKIVIEAERHSDSSMNDELLFLRNALSTQLTREQLLVEVKTHVDQHANKLAEHLFQVLMLTAGYINQLSEQLNSDAPKSDLENTVNTIVGGLQKVLSNFQQE